MATPLHVLIVDDCESDALLVLAELERCGFAPVHKRVETEKDLAAALADPRWRVVIADYSMPGFSGLSAVGLVKKSALDLPVIVVSGAIGEETAVAAMKAGASDYVMKDNLARLGPAVERELREAANRRERRRVSSVLRFTQFMVDHAAEAIYCVRSDATLFSANDAACHILGYTQQEMLGMKVYEFDNTYPREVWAKHWNELRERGAMTLETQHRAKDGRLLPVEANINFLKVSDGEYLVAFVRDITERKDMESKLRMAERMQIVGQLVLGVAHEVRNPLNCIMAVSEALREDLENDERYQAHLSHIHNQVNRLSELVRDLLDMGKPLDPSRMQRDSLPVLCNAAVALWREAAANKGRRVEISSGLSAGGLDVNADSARLQQVFINLLDNAAQHSPPDSVIRIALARLDDRTIAVRISDEGKGLAPEALEKLFEPFFTTRQGGTGLGLCIVQRVVRDHGGEIRILNNDPPPGCMVEIRLPRIE